MQRCAAGLSAAALTLRLRVGFVGPIGGLLRPCLCGQVKRLGRTIQQLEGEKAEAVSQRAEAVSREQAAARAHAELMATVESANRQRDQSLNAAAAAREVELAATTRANEVEAAAADALKKASQAEAEASMALASRQAAEVKADAARVTLAAREKELAALQAEQQEILESSQAVLKDYEELQGRCNDMLADLNVKAASLESVNAQLAAEEGHRQELTVQVGDGPAVTSVGKGNAGRQPRSPIPELIVLSFGHCSCLARARRSSSSRTR